MKSIILILLLFLCSSCAILDKLDFPDDVHERIENQDNTNMSNDNNFPI